MPATLGERIVALEQRVDAHDREFRDIKAQLTRIETLLRALNEAEQQRIGAMALGRWFVGGTFVTLLGAAAAGVWSFITRRGF